ncbi:MAG TPA: FHA domain-containing protein [Telluria sp.]
MARIIVTHGDMVEQEVDLSKPRLTIGRHPGNDIVIAHLAVSAQHAALTVSDSDVQIEDLGSTNGTFVNGERVARRTLADRDVIKVALHTIRFVAGTPAAAVAAPVASIEVMSGPNAGKKLTLVKPLTTLGTPGVLVVVIGREGGRYFIRQIDGAGVPLVNGAAMADAQCFLANGDSIELAGTRMQFSIQS